MNIGIDSIVEEIIMIELSEAGIAGDVIDKIIESIKYNCKETNFLNNSVADSNYHAAEERKENQKLIDARREKELVEDLFRKEKEQWEYHMRRMRNRLEEEMEKNK